MIKTLLSFEFKNLIKAKWLFAYLGFYFILTEALYYFNTESTKVFISLLNIILIVMPLVCIIYGVQQFYNSREYIQFLLAQPIKRGNIFISNYISAFLATVGSFVIGAGLPLLSNEFNNELLTAVILLLAGALLGGIFLSIGYYIGNYFDDKAKGLGVAMITWFFLCFLYDGIVLGILYIFSDYPIELPALILSMLNPNDLARILITLMLDVSAMMGYTGAVYKNILGSNWGIVMSIAIMLIWFLIPLSLSIRKFKKKDF